MIEQLKKFIKYRLALKEHAELVADAKQDLNFNVDVSGELATPPPPPSLAEQAARRTQRRHLRESQAKRRENVESLLETLEFTRDYYVSTKTLSSGQFCPVLSNFPSCSTIRIFVSHRAGIYTKMTKELKVRVGNPRERCRPFHVVAREIRCMQLARLQRRLSVYTNHHIDGSFHQR